jgi:hypothetical protein
VKGETVHSQHRPGRERWRETYVRQKGRARQGNRGEDRYINRCMGEKERGRYRAGERDKGDRGRDAEMEERERERTVSLTHTHAQDWNFLTLRVEN